MDRLRRIHYVARHYRQLQGLRLLPLSVPFLLSALWRLAFPGSGSALPSAGWVLLVAAAIAASALIGRYYTRRFGKANVFPWPTAVALGGSAAVVLALEWIQELRRFPVSLPVVFVAAVLARVGLLSDGLRLHYVWIGAACAVFAALTPLGVPPDLRSAALDLLVGGGIAAAGIGDDRVLRRAMTEGALA